MRQDQRVIRWEGWTGASREQLNVGFENGGWTADGLVEGAEVHYVVRCDPDWRVRQLMLFRDMDEPDLWLVTDGEGRWAEVNGGRRADLDGCVGVDLPCTPFTTSLPLRFASEDCEVTVAMVDHETLAVVPVVQRFTRLGDRRWRRELVNHGWSHTFEVDDDGVVVDDPGSFRRAD